MRYASIANNLVKAYYDGNATRVVQKYMLRWLLFCFLVASISMTLLGLFVDLTYQLKYAPKIAQMREEQQAKLEHYLQEKAFLASHPVFSPPSRESGNFDEYVALVVSKNKGGAFVNSQDRKKVLSAGKKWLHKRHLTPTNERLGDLFEQLDQYHFWKLTEPIANESLIAPIELVVAGQVFLANQFHTTPRDVSLSLAQTRKLSTLLLSTDRLNFKLAGLSLLEKEHHVINELNNGKKAEFVSWELIPLSELKRFRVFLEQTGFYLNFITPPEILNTVFLEKSLPPGFCAVFHKKQILLDDAEVYLKNNFPLEPSFAPNIASIDEIEDQAEKHCLGIVKKEREPQPIASRLPYIRRIRGIDFLLNSGYIL